MIFTLYVPKIHETYLKFKETKQKSTTRARILLDILLVIIEYVI